MYNIHTLYIYVYIHSYNIVIYIYNPFIHGIHIIPINTHVFLGSKPPSFPSNSTWAKGQSGEHGATALHVATARGDRNEASQNAIAQT